VRLQIGKQRNPLADLLDPFDRDRHLCLARDRKQMQVHVGRTAHRIDGGDRVLERPLGHDVTRPDAGFHQPVQRIYRGARLSADIGVNIAAGVVIGGMRGAARQHHTDRFRNRAHGIGGEHRAAGAAAGHHVALDFLQFVGSDAAGFVGGPGLGVVEDRQIVALARPVPERDPARRTGAGIKHQPKGVGPRQRHQRGGAGLVTAGNYDHCVAMVRVVTDLETIGDDIAGREAIARSRRSLSQRVRHCRCADNQALPAALGNDFNEQIADGAHAIVAAMRVGPGRRDRDHGAGLRSTVRFEAGGPEFDPGLLPVEAAVLRHDRLIYRLIYPWRADRTC
jgi:hypothetical protein